MNFDEKCLEIEHELCDEFIPHKEYDLELADVYDRLGMTEKAQRVRWCATQLDYKIPEDFSETPKLYRANFCKDRLCSMCGWRRSKKIFSQVSKVMDKLEPDYVFIFVTLTIRNCSADELKKMIDLVLYGFKKFSLIRSIKRAFVGSFKALEITRHPEHFRSIEYHPHLHCIFAVKKGYFKSKNYIKHDELIQYWRQACQLDYDPVVDIRKVKPKINEDGEINLRSAVCEVAKYAVKSSDLLEGTPKMQEDAVLTLVDSLSSRRLCSFSGVFKKAAQELKLDDMLDGDLVLTDGDQVRKDVGYLLVTYQWRVGFGYERHGVRRLEEEK